MKDKPNIDEMLHAYVDGELNTRQKTEVKRLLDRDESLAVQVKRIRQTKQWVGALPRDEAPADMAENVLAILERKTLLGERKVALTPDNSFRHRILRRIQAVAAVVVLFVALAGLVYSIMAPPSGPKKHNVTMANQDYDILKEITPEVKLAGTLSMVGGTDLLTQLNKGLQSCGLKTLGSSASAQGSRHVEIKCSEATLRALMRSFNLDWSTATDARFTVCALAGRAITPVDIPAVHPSQIVDLVDVADANQGESIAVEMATNNGLKPLRPWEPDDMGLPIPIITANEILPSPNTPSEESDDVRLVLILKDL